MLSGIKWTTRIRGLYRLNRYVKRLKRKRGIEKMGNRVIKKVSYTVEMWEQIQAQAKDRCITPNAWIKNILVSYLRGELNSPGIGIGATPTCTPVKGPKAVTPTVPLLPAGSIMEPDNFWGYDNDTMARLRDLQDQLSDELALLEEYESATVIDPATGVEGPDNPDADYMVECREKIATLETQIGSIVPIVKEI